MTLAELSGKNKAIHAYDGIIWKVRTGYLTLLFAGWAILLKSMIESKTHSPQEFESFVAAMFFFSAGLAIGGWFVDRTYIRRKHRVILALDRLSDAIEDCAGDFQKIPPQLLKVAGDNPDMPYESKGYREAHRDANCVFFVPLATLAVAASCIFILNRYI